MSETAENPWRYIGVDWDSGSWLAVGYTDQKEFEAIPYDSIRELWDEQGGDAERIVVDVPIGLCGSKNREKNGEKEEADDISRKCDDLAREIIGPRYRSVFTAPCRAAAKKAAAGEDYGEVNSTNRDCTGKGLSQQAASIAEGIIEVEELVLDEEIAETLLEGHPEVCFRAFADDHLQYSKKTAPGIDERLTALDRMPEYEQGDWRGLATELADREYIAGTDDLLDALALVLTALADDDYQTIPSDPPTDEEELPMQMVYRRPEPFEILQ